MASCLQPGDWVVYTVQPGDTLEAVAQAVGSTAEELQRQNCLSEADELTPDTSLYVPRLPSSPLATAAPTAIGTALPDPVGCTSPGVRIIAPLSGAEVTGSFNLVGAAALPPGGSYRVEIRQDTTTAYTVYSRAENSMIGGVLAVINSDLFDDGLYWIRLVILDASSTSTQSCAIPVIFR